jgi:hypothetical protein
MSEKRKPARHGGPDGQSPPGRRVLRRWGFRPADVTPAPEAPERPAHLPPAPNPTHTPPLAHRPAPPPPPPAHRQPPAGQAHRPAPPPPPPLAARRHPSNLDAVPRAVPSPPSPLPQRAARPPAGRPSTAAGEGSIDDITALMDFLRQEEPPGA